jgi:type VI secretion system secreted protein VgrG
MPHAGNDVEDHWRLGQVRMQRHEFESKCFHGEGSVRDFCAGEYFTLAGHPEIDTHPAPEREFVVTELHVVADNNLPRELAERRSAAAGRAPLALRGAPRAGALHGGAARRPIVPAFDPRTDLPHPQLQSALVVGPAGEEVHCDALGRVKIRFPGMRAADHEHAHGAGASGAGRFGLGAGGLELGRQRPGSRQQCGALGLPRVGTEVLVAFLGGDPDRPIVLAQLFNGRARRRRFRRRRAAGQPLPVRLPQPRDRRRTRQPAALRRHPRRDQRPARERPWRSELNLGWLTQPRAGGAGEAARRGRRTAQRCCAVAMRGARACWSAPNRIAARARQPAGRAGLVGLAEVMQGILDEVGKLAACSTRRRTGRQRLAELADKLKRWHLGSNVRQGSRRRRPIVAATAPAGILLASQDNLALGRRKARSTWSAPATPKWPPAATSSCARRAASACSRMRWA